MGFGRAWSQMKHQHLDEHGQNLTRAQSKPTKLGRAESKHT